MSQLAQWFKCQVQFPIHNSKCGQMNKFKCVTILFSILASITIACAGSLQLLGVGGFSFTPSNITPRLWIQVNRGGLFQNNDGTTPATSNGDVVGYLPDFSGNGNTYTSVINVNKTRISLLALRKY